MSDREAKSGGIGVLGVLGVVFVTLKLLGIGQVATWSWLRVLAPFWIGIAFVLVAAAAAALIALLAIVFTK